jgi:hypothetical protein
VKHTGNYLSAGKDGLDELLIVETFLLLHL